MADQFHAPLGHSRNASAEEESFTGSPAALALVRHVFDSFPHRERVTQTEFLPRTSPVVQESLRREVEKDLEWRLHHGLATQQKMVLWVDKIRWYVVPGPHGSRGAGGPLSWTEVPSGFVYPPGFRPAVVATAWVIPLFQPPQQKD